MAPHDADSSPPVHPSDNHSAPCSSLYASPPPPFGHALLKHFGFEKGYINLNHGVYDFSLPTTNDQHSNLTVTAAGSYGSLPTPLVPHLNALSALIESNPDRFMRLSYAPMLSSVRGKLAELIGAEKDEVVLVPNATHGVNTVVRNLDWESADIVVGSESSAFISPLIVKLKKRCSNDHLRRCLPYPLLRLRHRPSPKVHHLLSRLPDYERRDHHFLPGVHTRRPH